MPVKLTIKPLFGLSNRIYAIDSAISLAAYLGIHNIEVLWENNKDLGCSYADLFERPSRFKVKETRGFSRWNVRSYFNLYNGFSLDNYRYRWFNKLIGRENGHDAVIYCDQIDEFTNRGDIINDLRRKRTIYIASNERFLNFTAGLGFFKPVEQVVRSAERYVNAFTSHTIGVHIRRSDHSVARHFSPTEIFIKKMSQELERYPQTLFYTATDHEPLQILLSSRFGDRVLFHRRQYGRRSCKEIRDALVDLLCLSSAKRIWGSYRSSFSQLASELGKKPPLTIITEELTI